MKTTLTALAALLALALPAAAGGLDSLFHFTPADCSDQPVRSPQGFLTYTNGACAPVEVGTSDANLPVREAAEECPEEK